MPLASFVIAKLRQSEQQRSDLSKRWQSWVWIWDWGISPDSNQRRQIESQNERRQCLSHSSLLTNIGVFEQPKEGPVKHELLSLLVSAECAGPFNLNAVKTEAAEVIEGNLTCLRCKLTFPITRGIPRFLKEGMNADQKATANAFGYEWTHYSKLTDVDSREFLGWMAPLVPADFKDRVVLDAVCGKGRHIYLAAKFNARTVVGIDLSSAVESAYRNTRDLPNVHVIQADILDLPFAHRIHELLPRNLASELPTHIAASQVSTLK
jgi:uncharacterized protein YbaR (Trm112 family)